MNQEESEHNEVDGMKKGVDSKGEMIEDCNHLLPTRLIFPAGRHTQHTKLAAGQLSRFHHKGPVWPPNWPDLNSKGEAVKNKISWHLFRLAFVQCG